MIHTGRRHAVMQVTSFKEVAANLVKHASWVLCHGVQIDTADGWSWLLLNDSTSEDAIQEYAICLRSPTGRVMQADSYTVSWALDHGEELASFLEEHEQKRQAGTLSFYFGEQTILLHDPKEKCAHCA